MGIILKLTIVSVNSVSIVFQLKFTDRIGKFLQNKILTDRIRTVNKIRNSSNILNLTHSIQLPKMVKLESYKFYFKKRHQKDSNKSNNNCIHYLLNLGSLYLKLKKYILLPSVIRYYTILHSTICFALQIGIWKSQYYTIAFQIEIQRIVFYSKWSQISYVLFHTSLLIIILSINQ